MPNPESTPLGSSRPQLPIRQDQNADDHQRQRPHDEREPILLSDLRAESKEFSHFVAGQRMPSTGVMQYPPGSNTEIPQLGAGTTSNEKRMVNQQILQSEDVRPMRRTLAVGNTTGIFEINGDSKLHLQNRNQRAYGDVQGSLRVGGAKTRAGYVDPDYRINSEIDDFRSFVIDEANYNNEIPPGIYDAYPWIKPYQVLTNDGIHVLFDTSQKRCRFLLFNADRGYLSYLGETVHEAVTLYNFPDLASEKLIDDETGSVSNLTVIDPEFEKQIAKEFGCVPLFPQTDGEAAWRKLATSVSTAINYYAYGGVIGQKASTIADIIKNSSLEEARLISLDSPQNSQLKWAPTRFCLRSRPNRLLKINESSHFLYNQRTSTTVDMQPCSKFRGSCRIHIKIFGMQICNF